MALHQQIEASIQAWEKEEKEKRRLLREALDGLFPEDEINEAFAPSKFEEKYARIKELEAAAEKEAQEKNEKMKKTLEELFTFDLS